MKTCNYAAPEMYIYIKKKEIGIKNFFVNEL